MPDSPWLANLKYTMALDLSRGMSAGIPPKGLVAMLFEIPEVSQGAHLRENRLRPLALDSETDEERQEIVDALERVTPWLDLSEPEIAERLRGIAAMMMDGGASAE